MTKSNEEVNKKETENTISKERSVMELFQSSRRLAQMKKPDNVPKVNPETLQEALELQERQRKKELELQERQRKKEKRRSARLKIFSLIKEIIIYIAYVLFGGIGWVIRWTSETISEYIYENDQKRQKIIKCIYIVICILLSIIMLGTVCFVSKDIWAILYFSALGLMIIGWILFGVFYICYSLIFFLLKKARKIEPFAKLIAFCIVMVLLIGTVIVASAYFVEAFSPEVSQSDNVGSDYDRIEPTNDTNYYIANTQTKKYHLPSCSYLPSDETAIRIRRERIGAYDYSPCGHCNP